MAKTGCYLVPTLSAMRDCVRWAEQGALTPRQCEKILALGLDIGECVRVAKEYGVRSPRERTTSSASSTARISKSSR